ncbi:MAG: c-type cytochrome [Natronospirillum sp.]
MTFKLLSPVGRRLAWLLVGCLISTAGVAVASESAEAGDEVLATAVLAGGCAGCHGTDGELAGTIPAISGRSAEVMETQLLRFKNNQGMATVMNHIAAGYTDEELARLAQYFSAQ